MNQIIWWFRIVQFIIVRSLNKQVKMIKFLNIYSRWHLCYNIRNKNILHKILNLTFCKEKCSNLSFKLSQVEYSFVYSSSNYYYEVKRLIYSIMTSTNRSKNKLNTFYSSLFGFNFTFGNNLTLNLFYF